MDDDLLPLEAELKRLRPAAPTRDLLARLEGELATPAVQRASRTWWILAGALPIAAGLAFAIIVASHRDQAPSNVRVEPAAQARSTAGAPAAFKPIAAENVLYDARDEGFITLEDGTPARRERLNFVDTITWKNPRTNASVRWSVPREEVRVVPVIFQ